MSKLVYYVTSHGLGHVIRASEVIKALLRLAPELEILIRTGAPPEFFAANLHPCPPIHPLSPDQSPDLGLVQIDSLRSDFEASLDRVRRILAGAKSWIEKEAAFLRSVRAAAAAADIPFLAPAAAARAGLPSVVLANFTWDWIYEHYRGRHPDWKAAAEEIAGYYRQADLMVRFPLSPDLSARFAPVVEAGLTGRRAEKSRDRVRRELGLDPDKKAVLLTFSGLDLTGQALERMSRENRDAVFLYSTSLSLPSSNPSFVFVDDRVHRYPDLIGAADLVLTKPGYGIMCDALVNDAPLIYTDRGDFPEYPILARVVEDHLPHRYIPSGDLYAGRVKPYLGEPGPPRLGPHPYAVNGAAQAARYILDLIS